LIAIKTLEHEPGSMTLLAPYDGSELSLAAVRRATEFADYRGEPVVVLTVVPDNQEFAVERGWIDPGERHDPDEVAARFEAEVNQVAPDATFRAERPEPGAVRGATTINDVTRTIREVARELDVSMVFVGSDNAGRVSTPVTSVGSPISEDPAYDVLIVRHSEED
jgi:nucleotide-binding universal stress UspA family protein